MASSQQSSLPIASILPNISFHQVKRSKSYFGVIEEDGIDIHHVTDPDEFYKTFGYSQDIQKAGLLPDEFLWEEYTKKNCGTCLKIHMAEYLIRHSAKFRAKYAAQYEQWLQVHMQERMKCGNKCITCRSPRPCCAEQLGIARASLNLAG